MAWKKRCEHLPIGAAIKLKRHRDECVTLRDEITEAQAQARNNVPESYSREKRHDVEKWTYLKMDVNTGEANSVTGNYTLIISVRYDENHSDGPGRRQERKKTRQRPGKDRDPAGESVGRSHGHFS